MDQQAGQSAPLPCQIGVLMAELFLPPICSELPNRIF